VENGRTVANELGEFEQQVREPESSSEEDWEDDADRIAKMCRSADVDLKIAKLAKELRVSRQRRHKAVTQGAAPPTEVDAMRQQEVVLSNQIGDLRERRQTERSGELIIQGTVHSRGQRVGGAWIDVVAGGEGGARERIKTGKNGTFEHRSSAVLGRATLLTARKKGFAYGKKRVGGEGVKQVRIELQPITVKGIFKAEPGNAGATDFVDFKSGVGFAVPIGGILKRGRPFEGEVQFSAAVVDALCSERLAAMPALIGRTVSGATVPMMSLGAVFTSLHDACDGKDLTLRPGSSIDCNLPSVSPLPLRSPSVWHFDETAGLWEQTAQPLIVNGLELPAPDPDNDASEMCQGGETPHEAMALAREREAGAKALQAGREMFDTQRQESKETKICTCGFQAKTGIMPIVQEKHGLSKADPPKRIFAETEQDGTDGHVHLVYNYLSAEQRQSSAERASRHPEVILSHHLIAVRELLETPTGPAGRHQRPGGKHWRKVAKRALLHLRHVAGFLVDRAHMVDVATGEPIFDVDPNIFRLKALEQITNLWAAPRCTNSSPPTLHELREALTERGGDVAAAALEIVQAQAQRDDVALVRRCLRGRDPLMTARYTDIKRMLELSGNDAEAAAERLAQEPAVKLQADKQRVRETLYAEVPMAHPTSKQVEAAMDEVKATRQLTEAAATTKCSQAAAAVEEAKVAASRLVAAERAVDEAMRSGDLRARDKAERVVREATKEAQVAREAEIEAEMAAAEAAKAALDAADPANALVAAAHSLAEDPAVLVGAQEVYSTWTATLSAANARNIFGFEIYDTGWSNVDAPETNPPSMPHEAEPAPVPPPAVEEFFPPQPVRICPLYVSSIVLGAFDDGIFAANVSAHGIHHRDVDYSEGVQPDGTFSLVTMADERFELATHKSDGTSSFSFGPFRAQGPGRVTYLGLLEPPRENDPVDDGRERMVLPTVDIVLPRLEFAPHGVDRRERQELRDDNVFDEDSSSRDFCKHGERCTCFDGEGEEVQSEGEYEVDGEAC